MKPEELQDIYLLEHLKYLDLSFNNLSWLPETIYQLKDLKYLDLQYNNFPEDVKERIIQAFPNAEVILMSEMERRMRGLTKK
jgi:Leucine-rich repeat (LRR) protein